MKIGECDERDVVGVGYRLMTPEGLKTFDMSEREDYLHERSLVRTNLKPVRKKRSRLPPCPKCVDYHSKKCLPPESMKCSLFTRAILP
jgi:hypothetical protein